LSLNQKRRNLFYAVPTTKIAEDPFCLVSPIGRFWVSPEAISTPTMRGYAFHDDLQVDWSIYFYPFVDPDARRGRNANYASRLKEATATLVAGGWIVYDCRIFVLSRRSDSLFGGRGGQ
jgi:hypothetical protein